MFASADGSAAEPQKLPSHARVINASSIIGVIGVTLFIATETLAGAAAALWAVSGLLHLGKTPTLILGVILFAIAALATVWAGKLAWDAETAPENN